MLKVERLDIPWGNEIHNNNKFLIMSKFGDNSPQVVSIFLTLEI